MKLPPPIIAKRTSGIPYTTQAQLRNSFTAPIQTYFMLITAQTVLNQTRRACDKVPRVITVQRLIDLFPYTHYITMWQAERQT